MNPTPYLASGLVMEASRPRMALIEPPLWLCHLKYTYPLWGYLFSVLAAHHSFPMVLACSS